MCYLLHELDSISEALEDHYLRSWFTVLGEGRRYTNLQLQLQLQEIVSPSFILGVEIAPSENGSDGISEGKELREDIVNGTDQLKWTNSHSQLRRSE